MAGQNIKFSKYAILLFVTSLIIAAALLFFANKFHQHKKHVEGLIGKEVNGRINKLKDLHRGSYFLQIDNFNMPSLPIAYEIDKYNVQVGDSVSKKANSPYMIFYKQRIGGFEKCCEFEIRP